MHARDTYQLVFEERKDYLYVRIVGKDSFSASLSYWNEIADRVASLNCKKLLVHEDLIGDVADSEINDLITDLIPSGLIDVEIALFDENPNDQAVNEFGQSLANKKGARVRIFRSLEEARAWLTVDL